MKKKAANERLSLNKKMITALDNKAQLTLQGGKAIPTSGCPVSDKVCASIMRFCFPNTATSLLC